MKKEEQCFHKNVHCVKVKNQDFLKIKKTEVLYSMIGKIP